MADMVSILNTILSNGGTEYALRVPQATRDNITAVGNAILDAPSTTETFLNLLINRIAMTVVKNKTFKNPLQKLKSGKMPLGNTIQEMYTNPAKAKTFDQTGATLLNRTLPDTKVIYHSRNRQDQYEVTFTEEGLRSAFVSMDDLNKLFNGIITSLYSGDAMDEFVLMKNLMASAINDGKIVTAECTDITATNGAKNLVSDIANASSSFTYPTSMFNKYKANAIAQGHTGATDAITWTPKEDQIILMRSDVRNKINLDVLASAFNIDKVTLLDNILEVDTFGSASDQISTQFETYAILTDEASFVIKDNLYNTKNFYNPKGMYWNYFLNHWQTYSLSTFSNMVAFGHTKA